MFTKSIFKAFLRSKLVLSLLTLNIAPVFSNQLGIQENSISHTRSITEETEQQAAEEQKLIRVRRSGKGGWSTVRGKSSTRGGTSATRGGASAIRGGASAARGSTNNVATSLQRLPSHTRNASPTGRLSTTANSRKRTSPTKPQGSPPKLLKVQQKPVPPPAGGVVYAPTAIQGNERYKALQGLETKYNVPVFTRNPGSKLKEEFKLPWKNSSDGGMEHVLKRHTHEYYNGSTPAPTPENKFLAPPQSMFPKGTTPESIQKMTKEVVENPANKPVHQTTFQNVEFWQITGTANTANTPLVVGYRKFAGNKPSEIAQVYPRGAQYEVQVLPAPLTRSRRGIGDLAGTLLEGAADWLTARGVSQIMNSENTQRTLAEMDKNNKTLRILSLGFSNEENQDESISITWEPVTAVIPPGYYFELRKEGISVEQNDLPIFTDQPNENGLTTYFMRVKQTSFPEVFDSAALTIGDKKVTNLTATILSDHKIRLNWDPVDYGNKQISWAVLRNGERIDISGDTNSFEDNEIEVNQVYIYRVLAFMQEEEAWRKQEHSIFYSKPLVVSTEKLEDFTQDSFLFHTYLLSKEVSDLSDLNENPNEYFTSIKDKEHTRPIVQNSITPWEDSTPIEMLKGFIDVEVNGYSLLSSRYFDNVRMLWDYLLVMVEKYLKENQATIYFPDQPIPIALKKKSPGILEFQINNQFVDIDEKKCLTAILDGAEQFFALLNEVSAEKYSLLLGQIRNMQNQVQAITPLQSPVVQLISPLQAQRISLNRILLSWAPNTNQSVKKYKILLDNESLITLPAYRTSYTHIFQQTDNLGKCVYKLIAYDDTDQVIANYSIEIDIAKAYLEAKKIAPHAVELNWEFSEQTSSIGYYRVYRNDIPLEITNSAAYTDETPLAVGVYTYKIEALDSSMNTLAIEPIVIEKTVSNVITLNWVFSDEDIPSIEYYNIHRNGTNLGVTHITTYAATPRAIGTYTYEIKALDFSMKALPIDPLVERIEVIQEDIPQEPIIQAILQAQARRISPNEILLRWIPNYSSNVKNYELVLDDESLVVLTSDKTSYTHTFQPKERLGKCVYQLISYDWDDQVIETYPIEIEIKESYLQIKKIAENVIELNWIFSGQNANLIGFYCIKRSDTPNKQVQVSKNTTTFTDVATLTPGIYTYTIEPLDESGSSLDIEPATNEVVIIRSE